MVGIWDPDTVDVVAHDPVANEYVLFMVETRPWGSDPDQSRQLREKINSYAGFILDGSLGTKYPETSGQKLRIQLNCVETPKGEIGVITEHAAAQLHKLGVRFVIHVLG